MTRIDTVDQLDALPIGSVILSRAYVFQREMDAAWSEPGFSVRHPHRAIDLPATLLHVPGRDLVQEARANAWDQGHIAGASNVANVRLGVKVRHDNPYRDEAP